MLALFEQVFRAGPRQVSRLFLGEPKTSVPALLTIAETPWVDDLCSLSWLFYEKFESALSNPTILNPTFDGSRDVGGADGDFILNHCLVDVKSTINPRVTNRWLYQLLGYVLLEYTNQYYIIDEVALYLARQGVLIQWPLPELIDRLSGGVAPPLEELRGHFQRVVKQVH